MSTGYPGALGARNGVSVHETTTQVRAIGVSNFTVEHLEALFVDGMKIMPMVNQASTSLRLPAL